MYTAKSIYPNRMFSSVFEDIFKSFPANPNEVSVSKVPVNIYEDEDGYRLELQVAGRAKEEIAIKLDEGILTISAEAKAQEDTTVKAIRREFTAPAFKRSFTVDNKIDAEKIEAKYENGILWVSLPKKQQVKNSLKQIAIN